MDVRISIICFVCCLWVPTFCHSFAVTMEDVLGQLIRYNQVFISMASCLQVQLVVYRYDQLFTCMTSF